MVRQTIAKGLHIKLVLVSLLVAFALAGPSLAPSPADAAGRYGAEGRCSNSASHQTIQEGNTGKSVKHLQCLLNQWGYSLAVDGDFGPKTDAAVKDFQRQNGLTVDGIVGEITWDALHPGRRVPRQAQGAMISRIHQLDPVVANAPGITTPGNSRSA